MKTVLKELKDIKSENCVTVILNTHRTMPDNQKDPLVLKNLIKEAEQRLLANQSKKEAQILVNRLAELEAMLLSLLSTISPR